MKYSIVLAAVSILLFAACKDKGSATSADKKFVIMGTISASEAKKIYLVKVPAASGETMLEDSAVLGKDGKFVLGSNDTESVIYNLVIDQNRYPVASIINDTSNMEINIKLREGSTEFAEEYTVKGSPASEVMKDYMSRINEGLVNIYAWSGQADSLAQLGNAGFQPDSLVMLLRSEAQRLHDYTLNSLERSTNPALTIFQLGYYQYVSEGTPYGLPMIDTDKRLQILKETADRFPEHKAAANIYAQTAKAIQDMKEASWIGKEAPDFSLPNTMGQPVSLNSFRGKYVLVDFWASWCMPCRKENPTVVAAYQQYKHRNFTVLGVSLDRPGQKEQWIQAIQQDRLSWTHVSDLLFWQSAVVPLYKFEGIPFNVLVDPKGNVVAENLRGPMLGRTLDEVLPKN